MQGAHCQPGPDPTTPRWPVMAQTDDQERVMRDMATWLQFDDSHWCLTVGWPGASTRFADANQLVLALGADMPAAVAPWAAAFGLLLARGSVTAGLLASALRHGPLEPLALAERALAMAGGDAASAVAVLERQWREHVRAVGRTARRAVALLEPGDALALVPDDGAMLAPLLMAASELALRLTFAPELADMPWLAAVARAAGHVITAADSSTTTLTLVEAQWVDPTGAVWSAPIPADAPHPRYALSATGSRATAPDRRGHTAACAVAAIITPRGIYRPAMIQRHDDDRDLPHELIPLR